MKLSKKQLVFLIVGIVLLGALSRLLPHIWNFTPIVAIALFAGAYIKGPIKLKLLIPLACLLISDFALQLLYWGGLREFPGFHNSMPFIYISLILIVLLGSSLANQINWKTVLGSALASGLAFYLITNFGVWAIEAYYPKNFLGLMECYVAGIPFFRSALLGDVFYTGVLFAGMEWLLSKQTNLKKA